MPPPRTLQSNNTEISFRQELARKATHMTALIIPGGYYVLGLSQGQMLTIMIPIAVLMILIDISRLRQWVFWRAIGARIISPMIRKHEKEGDFTGATYILTVVCLTVAFFDKPIAIAAMAFIIIGLSLIHI